MMRLWIFSDVHIEQSAWDLPDTVPNYDVMIAAGDIHSPLTMGVRWLVERACGKPVIYVPGNHEWYSPRRKFDVAAEKGRAAELASELGVYLLDDSEVTIAGVRFLGSTLWTDYALYGDVSTAQKVAERSLNDHRYIFPDASFAPLRASQALQWHQRSRDWLEERLAVSFDGPTVVITHHLPHPGSIHVNYAGDPLTPAFCSNLSQLVEASGATLWIHGHTHSSFDYRAGRTRILCNPKGYGPALGQCGIENSVFDPALVITIPDPRLEGEPW